LSAFQDLGEGLLGALIDRGLGLTHGGEALGHLGILLASASGATWAESARPARAESAGAARAESAASLAAGPPAATASVLAAGSTATGSDVCLSIGVAIVAIATSTPTLARPLTLLSLRIHLIAEFPPALIDRLNQGLDLGLLRVFEAQLLLDRRILDQIQD
jgi:hypothetical protein